MAAARGPATRLTLLAFTYTTPSLAETSPSTSTQRTDSDRLSRSSAQPLPLGALPETQVRSRLTTGYTFAAGKWADASDTLPYRGTSAGGGYSTAGDLVRFAVALQSGRLLPQHLLQAATRGHVIPQYGQGFMLGGEGFNEWYGHYGGSRGMNGLLRIYPESGYVAVALSNLDPPAADALIVLLDQRLPLVLRPTAAIALKP